MYNHSMKADSEVIKAMTQWLGSGSVNIFGRPFAGKDTQGKRLAKLFGGTLLGGGEILRGSVVPKHVREAMQAGQLIPSDDYVKIVLPYLSQPSLAGRPLFLSSVGRWSGEEKGVVEALEASGHSLRAVVFLTLDEDTVRARWRALEQHDNRGGRHDDTQEILERRLEEFAAKTTPVIEAYRKRGLLIEVDGSQPPAAVTQAIVTVLASRASTSR